VFCYCNNVVLLLHFGFLVILINFGGVKVFHIYVLQSAFESIHRSDSLTETPASCPLLV